MWVGNRQTGGEWGLGTTEALIFQMPEIWGAMPEVDEVGVPGGHGSFLFCTAGWGLGSPHSSHCPAVGLILIL